jgi:hypothetical protein
VEHRLFGTEPGSARKYSSVYGEWKATGTGTVPDTLLGPEGSDESPTSGRLRPWTLTADEPPSLLGRRRHR